MSLLGDGGRAEVNEIVTENLIRIHVRMKWNYKKSHSGMNLWLILVLVIAMGVVRGEGVDPPAMRVGQIVPGKINPEISNQQLHPIRVEEVEKKYLFIRLSTFDTNRAAIGLYWNMTGSLLYSCMDNSFDTCYIPTSLLAPGREYVILVMSSTPISYNLYTYWGDLEHLKPDQEIKFMFDDKDKTQLFHLDLEEAGQFEQIRIVMRPETSRMEGDSLKIFANRGYKEEPTQEKHDYESIHVWNDAEAIFISRAEVKGEKGVAVYIAGNAKTVYILSCQFVRKDHHNLKLNENLYEYIDNNQEAVYHMKFEDRESVDVHVVRFSVFTGEVEVGFYYDRQISNPFRKYPYQYMSDIQFHINKADLSQGTTQLYMTVKARDKACTFQLNLQGRSKVQSFQINENVFEFVPIKQKIQSMHFYSHVWSQNQYDAQKFQNFDISMIRVEGQPTLQFYKCNPNENQEACVQQDHRSFATSAIRLTPVGQSVIGTKIIYSIQIGQADYKEINSVEKRALIVIHVKPQGADTNFVALEVSNSNKVRLLREGRSFEDKVRLSETKYYKYVSNNPNAGAIKIHINQISGLTKIEAYRSENVANEQSPIGLSLQQPNTILVSDNVTKPIFVRVTGIVTSIFTIAVSSVHKEHPLSNSLVMAEDIEYELKLLPYSHTNVELHPIESDIVFQYNSDGGSIVVCQLDSRDICADGTEFVGSRGQISINANSVRELKLRLANYVNTTTTPKDGARNIPKPPSSSIDVVRTVKVTLLYHAAGRKHCQQRKINKVYSQVVKSGSCFNFHLPLAADVEMMASRGDLDDSSFLYFVCSKKVNPQPLNSRYIIREPAIREACADSLSDMTLSMVVSDASAHSASQKEIRVDYSVEYTNDTITLADGVAYYTRAKNVQVAIKTFFYQIVDEFNSLQVVLLNKRGSQYFLAKIVENSKKYTMVGESEATINSKNSNYYANPSIQVSSEQIVKANCGRNCILVISVFSREKAGGEVEFGIEVTQHQIVLREGEIRSDYLSKGSINYYEYTTRVTPTDLLFKISDNNRKCAVSYLSNHPFPSPSNYIAYENQGSLTYKNAHKGRYYYAVEALEDCPYSISANEGNSKLTKIEHGQYYDIKLNEGEEVWFYLHHLSASSFKILSLLKHGLVDISVNKTELTEQVISQVSAGTIDSKNFSLKNSYPNSLMVSSEAVGFCHDCYYLVNVRARTLTEGLVFLGSENSKISMQANKVLFDQIRTKDSSLLALFYKVSKGILLVNVHAGRVKVEMSYEDQKFEKTFEKNKLPYNESYQFQQVSSKFTPIRIKITALEAPSVYSFQILPKIDNSSSVVRVNPGLSSSVSLSGGEQACFSGTLRAKDEFIYLSSDKTDNIDLTQLATTAKLDGKDAKIEKEVVGNILSLKFEIAEIFFAQTQPYTICLQAAQPTSGTFSLSLMQNEKINLVPPDSQIAVRSEGTFAIHENGYVIIDIFECEGRAQISYGPDLSALDNKTSKQLDAVGISGQNHAIRVQSQQVLFLKVKLGLGSLLWTPLNEQKQRGIGYYKYAIGKLGYATGFNSIRFLIGGVFKSKETSTFVQSVKYTLYIANSRQNLQKAVLCQVSPPSDVVSVHVNSSKVGDAVAPEIEVSLEKRKITETFKNDSTLYFNVVADLTLLTPGDTKDHEHYRFVYFEQLVLAELLRQNAIEQRVNSNMLLVAVVAGTIGLIAVLCVFAKWVVPALGKLKSRVLVEENNEDRDMEMEAPPSSDRNQMTSGTTDRMS